MGPDRTAAIGAVAALGDPQRSRLYDAVRAARHPVTREEAASAVDISRKLAAFHLDKLVACGLLETVVEPLPGRGRVGRAPKRYRRVPHAIAVSIPVRSYQELASVLVDAAAQQEPGEPPEQVRSRAAAAHGRERGGLVGRSERRGRLGPERALALVESVLAADGFEPYRPAPGTLRLANCPYRALADQAPALVCGINLAGLGGLLEGLEVDSLAVALAPGPGECCVEICAAT